MATYCFDRDVPLSSSNKQIKSTNSIQSTISSSLTKPFIVHNLAHNNTMITSLINEAKIYRDPCFEFLWHMQKSMQSFADTAGGQTTCLRSLKLNKHMKKQFLSTIDVFSSISLIMEKHNEQMHETTHNDQSSISSETVVDPSVTLTLATPTLPSQILTENEQEDNLIEHIDELIRSFLRQIISKRFPYRTLFKWTFDDEPSHLSYSVLLKIQTPSPLI